MDQRELNEKIQQLRKERIDKALSSIRIDMEFFCDEIRNTLQQNHVKMTPRELHDLTNHFFNLADNFNNRVLIGKIGEDQLNLGYSD